MNSLTPTPEQPTSAVRPITARKAMAYIPGLDEFCDAGDGPAHLISLRDKDPRDYGNLMFTGTPGSGKTRLVESFLREVFSNPLLHDGDVEDAGRDDDLYRSKGIKVDRPSEDVRFWQTNIPGKIYAYVRIEGATDTPKIIERKVNDALYCESTHTFMFIDEAGELYFRGLEECLRPILTAENITTLATAQNFHAKKRKTDSVQDEEDRLGAFLRRFPKIIEMQKADENAHLRFLARRISEWDLQVDHASTLRLLVQKSDGVVGYSLRLLIRAINEPARKLTEAMVSADDVNPVNR